MLPEYMIAPRRTQSEQSQRKPVVISGRRNEKRTRPQWQRPLYSMIAPMLQLSRSCRGRTASPFSRSVACLLRLRRLYILVQAEEVCRVVASLQLRKAAILRFAIGAARDAGVRLLVDIVRLEGERHQLAGRPAAPGDRLLVVSGTVPRALGDPVEGAGPAGIGRGVLVDIADRAAELQAINLDPRHGH